MSRLIKILHIDPDYQVTYLIYRPRTSIRTSVPLQTAIKLLKKEGSHETGYSPRCRKIG